MMNQGQTFRMCPAAEEKSAADGNHTGGRLQKMNGTAEKRMAGAIYPRDKISEKRQLPALSAEKRKKQSASERALEEIVSVLPDDIARTLRMMPDKMSGSLEEIRFRAGRPVTVYAGGREYEMYRSGDKNVSQQEVEKIFHLLVRHSAYSYQEDL